MVPFWVPMIIRHLIFRVPRKGTIILTTTHLGILLGSSRKRIVYHVKAVDDPKRMYQLYTRFRA